MWSYLERVIPESAYLWIYKWLCSGRNHLILLILLLRIYHMKHRYQNWSVKHMKRCSMIWFTREIRMKTAKWNPSLHPPEHLRLKRPIIPSTDEDVEHMEFSHADGDVKYCSPIGKNLAIYFKVKYILMATMQGTWFWSLDEGNGCTLQYSCLKTPLDRGSWWATVYGVAKS